jgi:hypothetical protein
MMSPEVVDKRDSIDAQEAFLRGAVTGLLVTKEFPGDAITPEEIMSSLQSLCDKDGDGRIDMMQVRQKGQAFFEQVNDSTKDILKLWAEMCDVDGSHHGLYEVGFGLIMAGATSASAEREFLGHLESSYAWEEPTAERLAVALQSIDNDCGRLAAVYQKYLHDADLMNCSAEDAIKGLAQVAAKVNNELGMMTELQIDDCLQTRGDGVCLVQDEDGIFLDFQSLDDTRMIRGKFLGIDILPVPTEYALITQEFEDENAFEPLPCLMLEDAEAVGATDDVEAMNGIVAVPLQVNGLGMDRVIFQTGR